MSLLKSIMNESIKKFYLVVPVTFLQQFDIRDVKESIEKLMTIFQYFCFREVTFSGRIQRMLLPNFFSLL